MFSKLLIGAFLLSCGFVFSQETNCNEQITQLAASINERKFVEANTVLKEVPQECYTLSEKFYFYATKVLQYNIDNATADNKESEVNKLLALYDSYDKNFPENKNGNTVNKAMVLFNSKLGKDNQVFALLDQVFTKNKSGFTNGNPLYIYFSLFYNKLNKPENRISVDALIEKYNETIAIVDKNKILYPENTLEFENARMAIRSLVEEYLTPKYLIPFAENNFEKNKTNPEWLEAVGTILLEKCDGENIFEKVVTQINQLKVTSKSTKFLAYYNLKKNDKTKAVEFFKQSAALETDKIEKSKTYYIVASQLMGSDKAQAKKMINSAIENNSSIGKYYLFLSNLYSNSVNECGATPIEKKAIWKLASLTAKKAIVAEPRLKSSVEQMEKEFIKNAPSVEELKQINKAGGKVTVGCWINETVDFK